VRLLEVRLEASNLQREQTEYLMSTEELAKVLGLGRTRTYELLSNGTIPCVRIGRLRKVRRTDVDKFIESHLEPVGE
jgi:excisionase family DNA binding protein